MDTPNVVNNAGAGVSKALNMRNLVFVAIMFFVVVMLVKYFTKQEIVDNDGRVTGTLRSRIALNTKEEK